MSRDFCWRLHRPCHEVAEYERFVQKEMAEKKIPGLTVGFFESDCTWVAAFGTADLENRVPVSVDSAYRYASVQKSMTAAAVLQLAEQGTLDLDAEVQTFRLYEVVLGEPLEVIR